MNSDNTKKTFTVPAEIELDILLSQRGIPAIWENGGKKDDEFGTAFLIADKNGAKKVPLFVKDPTKVKPNKGQALVPIRENDIVLIYSIKGNSPRARIYSIVSIDTENKKAALKLENAYINGSWQNDFASKYSAVLEAAKEKAATKDCLVASYVAERKPRVEA